MTRTYAAREPVQRSQGISSSPLVQRRGTSPHQGGGPGRDGRQLLARELARTIQQPLTAQDVRVRAQDDTQGRAYTAAGRELAPPADRPNRGSPLDAASPWPAWIQRCGIGSSCGCEPHDKVAGVARDLQRATFDGGAALPGPTQAQMGGAFSADFSAVRVHTGPAADKVASTLQAHALTTGSDIMFRAGAYRPGTPSGDRLLAHELAHVVQQSRGLSRASLDGGPADPLERAADRAAEVASSSADGEAYGAAVAGGRGERVPVLSRRFAPGMSLLAHELTQVVPQSGGGRSRGDRYDKAGAPRLLPASNSEKPIQRKGFESTVEVCRRELESHNFEVSKGGLRVVLIVDPLPESVRDCQNFKFWVTLTRSRDWWPDDELATCEASTEASTEASAQGIRSGGARSVSFANLAPGTYYLTFARAFDHPYCCLTGELLVFDEPVAGDTEGCTRDTDPSVMDIVHGALDVAGFIPVLGAIPDGINAAIYVVEGDWANAGLSAVAMVPAWGDGVKLGAMGTKTAIKITDKAAIRLGKEGIATGLKDVKAASKAEKAALETTEEAAKAARVEKGVAQGAAKTEKEAAERAAKAEKEAAERAARKERCYAIYLEQTAYCGATYTDDRLYEICMANAWRNYIRCLNGLPPLPLNPYR